MAQDSQRQSPVLSQIAEASEAHIASLPLHARRKFNRLAIQVALSLLLALPKLTFYLSIPESLRSCCTLALHSPLSELVYSLLRQGRQGCCQASLLQRLAFESCYLRHTSSRYCVCTSPLRDISLPSRVCHDDSCCPKGPFTGWPAEHTK